MTASGEKKKIKMRSCVACRESRLKSEFLRLVRSPEGEYFIDETGKANGRGAYICKSKKCAEAAKKRRQFDRSFKEKVPAEIYDKVTAALEESGNE